MAVVRKSYHVYIMTNQRNGTLYTGVTGEIERRVRQHKLGHYEGFTKRYGLKRLVYYERFETPDGAIRREKQIKAGSRRRKLEMIESMNPAWRDLSDGWYHGSRVIHG